MSQERAGIERWGIYEVALEGPDEGAVGNPFTDVTLSATFRLGSREVEAPGFYDGDGVYRIRFMPDASGEWSYVTHANHDRLTGQTGGFRCLPPGPGNHGPVVLRDAFHFGYADGSAYFPVGTTCYAWTHQGDDLEEQTLQTLRQAPFNKMRMCIFPKHYTFSENEPPRHPFEGEGPGKWDLTRFNPEFFRHQEKRIGQLRDLGIEADLILFHPYDRWGYSRMPAEADDRYLRYVVARLWAYRNVWWSMANEYDFMREKSLLDWDRFFRIVQESDPAQHLRSIHNGNRFYDHGKPWVTHCSIQSRDLTQVAEWRAQYRKPVVVDECSYEGNIQFIWGNIPAREMVHRFWEGFARGGYVGHGETYLHPQDILWWSKGGVLHGESPERIAFLRRILEDGSTQGFDPHHIDWNNLARVGRHPDAYLQYFGVYAPARWQLSLPAEHAYRAEVIDTWEMTVTPVEGRFSGKAWIDLPGRPYLALRLLRA
jgi:hypothetical protein